LLVFIPFLVNRENECVVITIFALALIAYQIMVLTASPLRQAFVGIVQFSWLAFIVAGILSLISCWLIASKSKQYHERGDWKVAPFYTHIATAS